MEERVERLLKAIKEMRKVSDFQDEMYNSLKIEVYETAPCIASGTLFDLLLQEMLITEGIDMVNAFLFEPYPDPYGEENPYDVKIKEEGKPEVTISIRSDEELCQFLKDYDYFK